MYKSVADNIMTPLWKLAGSNYNLVRLAGLSGASAVILGAIGSHHLNIQDKPELRNIFDTANRFHFFNSLALLGMPLAKYPLVSGTLVAMGTALFSGSLYYRAFTGNAPPVPRMAPIGGTCLILGWLSLKKKIDLFQIVKSPIQITRNLHYESFLAAIFILYYSLCQTFPSVR